MNCSAFIIAMNDYCIIHCEDKYKTINTQKNLILVLHWSSQWKVFKSIIVMINAKHFKHKQNYYYFCIHDWRYKMRNTGMVIIKYGSFYKYWNDYIAIVCGDGISHYQFSQSGHRSKHNCMIFLILFLIPWWIFYITNMHVIIKNLVNKKPCNLSNICKNSHIW